MGDFEAMWLTGAAAVLTSAGIAYWRARLELARGGAASAWAIGWKTGLCCLGLVTVANLIVHGPTMLSSETNGMAGSHRGWGIFFFVVYELFGLGLSLAAGAGALLGVRRSANPPNSTRRAPGAALGAACVVVITYLAALAFLVLN